MKYLYFYFGIGIYADWNDGVVLPILPTTPFLLAALFFFLQRVHREG